MAKASFNKKVVTIVEEVTLTLTVEEAAFLATITRYIAGGSGDTPRGYADSISSTLCGFCVEICDLIKKDVDRINFLPQTLTKFNERVKSTVNCLE